MLIPQQALADTTGRQGRAAAGLAELRRRLAHPSRISDGNRQRLLALARRLSAVRALGDEYARVDVSEYVRAALGQGAQAIA